MEDLIDSDFSSDDDTFIFDAPNEEDYNDDIKRRPIHNIKLFSNKKSKSKDTEAYNEEYWKFTILKILNSICSPKCLWIFIFCYILIAVMYFFL